MELVPEEKLVVITTEKPMLSPSNENVEETLFPVDFDVDSSLEIEVTLTNMHQFVSLLSLVKSTLEFRKIQIFKNGKTRIFRNT